MESVRSSYFPVKLPIPTAPLQISPLYLSLSSNEELIKELNNLLHLEEFSLTFLVEENIYSNSRCEVRLIKAV